MNEVQKRLCDDFKDAEYAAAYMEGHVNSKLAAQIYWTRKKRGWSQQQLAERSGIAQERISKIENGEFSSLTMKTLRKFAGALDVNLNIEFEPYSHAVVEVAHPRKQDLELLAREDSLHSLKNSFMAIPAANGVRSVILSTVAAGPLAGVVTTTAASTATGAVAVC